MPRQYQASHQHHRAKVQSRIQHRQALDGVSLTVNTVKDNAFSVNVIQHSWDVTGWGQAVVGQKMNMEIDMLARYVARLAVFDRD